MIKDYIYLEPGNSCFYLSGKGLHKGKCYICGKKRKTTAHHIIPKRMHKHCKNNNLKEVRIRICKRCENLMHPENVIIQESDALKLQKKNINNLKAAIEWRNEKIKTYENNFKKFRKLLLNFGEKLGEIDNKEYKYNGIMPGSPTPKDYELYSKNAKLNNIKNHIKVFKEYLIKFAEDIEKLFNISNEQFYINEEKEEMIEKNELPRVEVKDEQ
jgi:hypothetical protein